MERASFEDELAKESIHLRIKIIRPAEPGEDEGYNNEDDEDDVKGHLMRASGRANTNNISNNDRARLADRNSSNTGSDSPLYHVLVTPRANLSHKSRLTECPDGIDLGSSGICSYQRKSCLRDLPSKSEGGEADGLAVICFGRPNTWSINLTMVLIKYP
ncbi:hypothetical protein PPACK8108_LOCUS9798 [Phakopsora pachyrhizi]|uniref:Uncharacterized protein n=1 Tax=Phakopsora pachyrhizi TaxID=170000 RepID=A0AAV0AZV6_PHAPC|nr:hypothetical protein PPACK8108_LOCUS9798 [Phakopsora pachyrhizi]